MTEVVKFIPAPLNRITSFKFISESVPDWLLNTTEAHRDAIRQSAGFELAWFHGTSSAQRSEVKKLIAASWSSRQTADKVFARLTEVEAFAASLLSDALQKRYGVITDVRKTCLRLYLSKGLTGGFEVRTLSLLEACLQNFELKETRTGYFDTASDFITRPGTSGQFEIVPILSRVSVQAFTRLCRELDVGARYQTYLDGFFDLANPVARSSLEQIILARAKNDMSVACKLALMKNDIAADTHSLLMRLVKGDRQLVWGKKLVHGQTMTMMGIKLSGIVMFSADLESSSSSIPVIVYVPHDPDHPLKQYASSAQFVAKLTEQLRSQQYQRFFSRFVPYQHQGRFFFQLNNRLSKLQWHAPAPYLQLPAWGPEPVPLPDLRVDNARIKGSFWAHEFQRELNALFADARTRAVPTDDEDAKSRWARWDSFQTIALAVLEVAVFVAAPFVPLLGEMLLAYTAYQLLDETFEGIVEWAEGQRVEAAEHLIGVVENLVQLGVFVAGGQVAGALLPLKSSPLIERMKVVDMGDGRSRLWDTDLERYAQSLPLSQSVRPNYAGIYQHATQEVLPLEGKHFVVRAEPGTDTYRIQHPDRADAYAPRLTHNGSGAWVHEAESPQAWQGSRLMRRLGHQVEVFSDQVLEQIRIVSGIDEGVLRKLHVEHEQPSGVLAATIKRFRADQSVETFIEKISSPDRTVYGKADVQVQLELLTRHQKWPKHLAVQWLDVQGSVLWQTSPVPSTTRISLRVTPGVDTDLAARLLTQLQERDIKSLLDEEFGIGIIAQDVRAGRLRMLIATAAREQRMALVDARFKLESLPTSSDASRIADLLRHEFSQLPDDCVNELLVDISPEQARWAIEQKHLPMQLKQAARMAMQEWRIVRAYEGLYLPANATIDTRRLALHSLQRLQGWSPEVFMEIRSQGFNGLVVDSIGSQQASIRKVLVRTVQDKFQVYDADGSELEGGRDFYDAVLQALPDAERRRLDLNIGQGDLLQRKLQQSPITRAELQSLLGDMTIRTSIELPVVQGYALINERLLGAGGELGLEDRFKTLYPQTTEDAFAEFLRRCGTQSRARQLLSEREQTFNVMETALDAWVAEERGALLPMDQRFHKGRFAKALKQCWQASELPRADGHTLDLDYHWTSDFLEYLPTLDVDFSHVSALQFRHVELRSDISDFLRLFPQLKTLDLSENALVALPRLNGSLRTLETLNLTNNQLQLTAESVAELRNLHRLQSLRLGGNPSLEQLPNFSEMAQLQVLDLHDTGITEWPEGLFVPERPRTFELDLQGNPIEQVPQVIPGSDQARLIARARLSRDRLSDQGRERFNNYMRSVGYDPARSYPPKGELTSAHWLEGVIGEGRQRRQTMWDELEREPDSQGFFEVLEQLAESADYTEDASRSGLTDRVWRMLDASSQNTVLREELFRMASNPDSCADAGAQIFNEMGVKVLVHEAHMADSFEQVEASLIRLAKGKSRLDQVNEVARAHVQSQLQAGETFIAVDDDGDITGTIDEVEVYLAFQTGLADRLELPWQSRGMLFREMAEVSEAQIEQAYQSVLSLETGDGLIRQMIEQPFWRRFLKGRHAKAFEENSAVYSVKSEALLNRYLSGSISQRDYERELVGLAEGRKALLSTLTQDVSAKVLMPK
ncbi:NEL-type E3 ubiquitin ligase domain-containing protein [Pseudomonas sp. McL0111]|uniref:NEL-type E3 ubiquitin ligase domain-containing protein n=1 Tax=Pseudomonas sp. McL0111 TaxID=3457357 RepID=UPI00403ED5F0